MITSNIHTYKDITTLKKFLSTNITDSEQLLVQLFLISTDETYINNILKILNTYLPNSHIIGATTDGSIVCNENTDVTTISFTHFGKSQLQHTFVPFELTEEDKCAQTIAKKILNKNSKLLIILADGLLCNASKLTQEFLKLYPEITIAGGLAGDNAKLKKTLVCDNHSISSQSVVALSIESDSLLIHTDYNLAWDAIGDTMEVTKCQDNIIYEINGKKAVGIFQNYFNKQYLEHYTADKSRPTISIEFPIILNRGDMKVARVFLKMNEDGSIFCSGEFVLGDIISFSFTNNQKIIQSAIELSNRMQKVPIQTLFIYSCMARRRFMGDNIVHDLKYLENIAPLSGFYSYGEIYTTPQSVEILNHTMTVLALSEDDDIYTYPQNTSSVSHIKNIASEASLSALISLLKKSTSVEEENLAIYYKIKTQDLFVDGKLVKLSQNETKLFKILFKNKNIAIDERVIFSDTWDDSDNDFSKESIRTLVKNLRKKLPDNSLENIYGGFYKLIVS